MPNLIQLLNQFKKAPQQMLNKALANIPENERNFIMQYKNNPMQGIIQGAKQGKISLNTFNKLKEKAQELRLLGVKIPMNKLNEVEQIIKSNSNNGNNSQGGFNIFG